MLKFQNLVHWGSSEVARWKSRRPHYCLPFLQSPKTLLLEACNVFVVRMIQIWTFPAAPSTEQEQSIAERVAYLIYSINLRFLTGEYQH